MMNGKDMEQGRVLMETDTSGNGVMVRSTGMEYTDGLMGQYITESGYKVIKKGKDIKCGQMAMNIGENGRITCYGEKESNKRREYSTKTHIKKTSASVGFK